MNFTLSQIPKRFDKPRTAGITMVMDKGLSVEEAKNFLSVAHPHVDIVKLGFGTSFVTANLKEKLDVYRSYGMPIYPGGTILYLNLEKENKLCGTPTQFTRSLKRKVKAW